MNILFKYVKPAPSQKEVKKDKRKQSVVSDSDLSEYSIISILIYSILNESGTIKFERIDPARLSLSFENNSYQKQIAFQYF